MPEDEASAVAGVGMAIGTGLEYIFCPGVAFLDGAVESSIAIAKGGKLVGIKAAKSVAKNVVKKGILKSGAMQVGKSLLTVEGGKLISVKAAEKAGSGIFEKVFANGLGSRL